jgi:hypothetical protein
MLGLNHSAPTERFRILFVFHATRSELAPPSAAPAEPALPIK